MNRLTSITLLSFLTILLFSFSSCAGGNQSHADQADHSKHMEESNSMATSSVDTNIPKEQAQNILTAYLKVKDALVQTDGAAASQAATKLVSTLGDGEDEHLEKIRFDAEHIAEAKDPTYQREYFNTLSENVFVMLKATEANESPIYRQYCPMAFDSKGAFWLAAEKEVNNPYFGDKMLHCGSVKEEL